MADFSGKHPELVIGYNNFHNVLRNYSQLFKETRKTASGRPSRRTAENI